MTLPDACLHVKRPRHIMHHKVHYMTWKGDRFTYQRLHRANIGESHRSPKKVKEDTSACISMSSSWAPARLDLR